MRILITNFYFRGRSGSEIVTAELALGLLHRGHQVAVYAPLVSGAFAEDVRRRGVAVIDALSDLPWQPDLIHGHHNAVLAAALLWFPQAPAVLVSHHPEFWIEGPLAAPQIKKVFAVSEACRDRLATEGGLAPEQVGLLLNAVDLDRFQQRPALPHRPRRALVLTKNSGHLPALREAASAAGLELDELGSGVDVVVDDLHTRLPGYDMVFATGRMALEALACGCAVVVVDARGLGGMVTSDVLEAWRRHNLGQRLLQHPVTVAALLDEIARYDAEDAREVSNRIRASASLQASLDEIEAIHRSVVADRSLPGLAPDRPAVARLYERVMRHMAVNKHWWQDLSKGQSDAERIGFQLAELQQQLRRSQVELDFLRDERRRYDGDAAALRAQHQAVLDTWSWRMTAPARWVRRRIDGARRQ